MSVICMTFWRGKEGKCRTVEAVSHVDAGGEAGTEAGNISAR